MNDLPRPAELLRRVRDLRRRPWVRGTSFVVGVGYTALLISGQLLHSRHAGLITVSASVLAYLVWRWVGPEILSEESER